MGARHAHARFDDLDLDARSQWVGKGKTNQRWMLSATTQAISIKLARTVSHFYLRDLDFANVHKAGPASFNT